MSTKNQPAAEAQMLIRKPVSDVFHAFTDPAVTTCFWFTKSSGHLETGKIVTWEWEMYGVSADVTVKKIVENKMIKLDWEDSTTTEIEFDALADDATYVIIKHYGFREKGRQLIETIRDNTGGYTTVLDGLKAYLEFGINLNLIADKFPNKPKSK